MASVEEQDAQAVVEPVAAEGPDYSALFITDLVERIISHMDFETLKRVRLLNHFWFTHSQSAWARKTQIEFRTLDDINHLLTRSTLIRKEFPYTVQNWVFKGETLPQLMNDEGFSQRALMDPFWSSITSITFADFVCRRRLRTGRWVLVRHEDNRRRWHYRIASELYEYWEVKKASALQACNMFKLTTNLAHLKLHFPILVKLKGTRLGPKLFPELAKLTRLELYWEGKKWDPELSQDEPERRLQVNLSRAEQETMIPLEGGGEVNLVTRLLDHSPNLAQISFNGGTLMSKQREAWFLGLLFGKTVNINLRDFQCSIPLNEEICKTLQAKPWALRSLHLKIMPLEGIISNFAANIFYDMVASFSETLEHLELVFFARAASSAHTFLNADFLHSLRSLELWGFVGSLEFLKKLRRLRKLVVGVTEQADYDKVEAYLQANPIEWLEWELKTVEQSHLRLDQGPISPFKVF